MTFMTYLTILTILTFRYFAGMKRSHIIFLLLFTLFYSCKSKDQPSAKSENNIDATRNFIRSALDGKFNEARNYLLTDSINTNYMDVVERAYQNIDQRTKDGYRESSIRIHGVNPVNDSITIVIYSNSFKNDPDTLKVMRINNQWLVDLKYLYMHDLDTMMTTPVTKDSIP